MTEQERKERLLLELSLLQKSVWRWRDITAYFQCASAKANEIRKRALKAGGRIDFDPHGVQSRYVLQLIGTTPETEIRKRVIELNGGAAPTESYQEKGANDGNIEINYINELS